MPATDNRPLATGHYIMDSARIAALLEPFLGPPNDHRLTTKDHDQISTYIDLLLRWNSRINLTAIRDPETIVTRHFGESFFLARHLFPGRVDQTQACSQLVLDLGSGAGFPGIPVKIWAPQIQLVLVESNHKKAAFLREAARALTLTNVDVMAERAESLALHLAPSSLGTRQSKPLGSRQSQALRPNRRQDSPPAAARDATRNNAQFLPADVVTMRAIEKFEEVLPLAVSLLARHGRLALLTTPSAHIPTEIQGQRLQWQIYYVPQSHERTLAIGTRSTEGRP